MKFQIKTFFALLLLLISFQTVNSQVLKNWYRIFSSPGSANDRAEFIRTDGFGNIYVAGNTGVHHSGGNLYGVVKYDPSGNLIWNYIVPSSGSVQLNAMTTDNIGNIFLTGRRFDEPRNILTVKINSDGQQGWMKYFSGVSGFPSPANDHGNDIAVDNDGFIYVTGTSTGMGTMQDYILIKYDQSGDSLWSRRYNGTGLGDDVAYKMVIDSGNNIYITGYSYGAGSGKDIVTIKYNSSGDMIWEHRFDHLGQNDTGLLITLDENENVVVSGGVNNDTRTVILKISSSGNLLWSNIFLLTGEHPSDLKVDKSNNIIIANTSSGNQARIYKLSGSGSLIWQKIIPATQNLFTKWASIDLDQNDNIYYAGNIETQPVRGNVLKIDSSGNQIWNKIFIKENLSTYLTSIKVKDENNIYTAGFVYSVATNNDFLLIKYSQPENVFLNNFNLISPESNILIDLNSMSGDLNFTWTRSNSSQLIYYKMKVYRGANDPEFYLLSNNSGSDTVYTLTHSTLSSIAQSYQTNSDTLILVWRAAAYNTNDSLYSQTSRVLRVTGIKTSITQNEITPMEYSLQQNYPNPFNPVTVFSFSVPIHTNVTLELYDNLGRKIKTLLSENLSAGSYNYTFDATNLPSGIYYYRLISDEFSAIRKMVLVR